MVAIALIALVILSIVFCIIKSQSGKSAWLVVAALCSVAAGVLGAVLCMRAGVGIMMYFATKALGSGLDYVVDFAALTVLFALVCLLCSMLIGSAFNAKKDGKMYCPLWKLLLSIFSVAAGVAITLCFFYLLLTKHVGAAALSKFRVADTIFMLSGLAFVLSGIVGISRWRNVCGRIAVQKAEAKAAAKAAEEKQAQEKAEAQQPAAMQPAASQYAAPTQEATAPAMEPEPATEPEPAAAIEPCEATEQGGETAQ